MINTPISIKTKVSSVCVYETSLTKEEYDAAFNNYYEWKKALIEIFPELSQYKYVFDMEKGLYWLRFYETQVSFEM